MTLAVAPTPTTRQAAGGDRTFRFYERRDIPQCRARRELSNAPLRSHEAGASALLQRHACEALRRWLGQPRAEPGTAHQTRPAATGGTRLVARAGGAAMTGPTGPFGHCRHHAGQRVDRYRRRGAVRNLDGQTRLPPAARELLPDSTDLGGRRALIDPDGARVTSTESAFSAALDRTARQS